jgi:hypothetical protein
MFSSSVDAPQRRQLLERQQDQVAVGQRHRFRRVLAGVDAVHAQHVALHGEAQHLFVAVFVDEHGFEEAGVDDVQGVEGWPMVWMRWPVLNCTCWNSSSSVAMEQAAGMCSNRTLP